jgi:hypothetical protein
MVSPTDRSRTTQFAPYPGFPLPREIPLAAFTQHALAQGASLHTEGAREVVSITSTPGEPPHRLAAAVKPLPLTGNKEGWLVLMEASIAKTGTGAALFERGFVDPVPKEGGVHTQIISADEMPDSSFHWHALGGVSAHDNDEDLRFTLFAGVPEKSTAAGTVTCDRAILLPMKTLRSGSHQRPISPVEFGPVAWSPDGSRLWGLVQDQKEVVAWKAEDMAILAHWSNRVSDTTTGLAHIQSLAAGNRYAICGGRDGYITILPAGEGALQPVSRFFGPGGQVQAVAIDPTESWAVIGTSSGKVQIREIPSGNVLGEGLGHTAGVQSVSLARQGSLLATAREDGVVRLVSLKDLHQPELWFTLNPRLGQLNSIRLTADGRFLAATGRNSQTVCVWRLDELSKRFAELEID